MNDPLDAILNSSVGPALFPVNSRYHGTATAEWKDEGRDVRYLRRRFVPPAENHVELHQHMVVSGDRIDNLAARYVGDPQQFWRLCDANGVLHPDDLTAHVGIRIRITLPLGVTG